MISIVSPVRIEKPWGYELLLAYTEKYVAKLLHINAGQQLSRQFHQIKDETLYVLTGTLVLEIGRDEGVERLLVHEGRGFRIVPGTVHRFSAPGEQACDLIEASTPELSDVVRLEDQYGREGTSEP